MSFRLHVPPSLKHRRFRLLWIGLLVSVAGSRMQFWALLWHIRELNEHPIALGGIGLARIIPIVTFSLIGGAVADSFNRRRIIFITQSIQALTAVILGALTVTGSITIWHIYALTAVQAAAQAFDLPARQSLTPNLVPTRDLPNAFSMQSISFTFGAILGPSLSGFIIGYLGLEYVYYINAVSYLAVILAVVLMGEVAQDIDSGQKRRISFPAIQEGIRYILGQKIIFSSMILDFFATFFSSANALLPIFITDIIDLSALTRLLPAGSPVKEIAYGILSAAESLGSAITAGVVSQFDNIRRQGRILLGAVVMYGVATVVFGFSRSFTISMLALMVIGGSDTVSAIIRNTVRQLQTPDRLRGRMTSINQIFFMGGPQLGEMEAGLVAQFLGPVVAVVSGGVGCILAVGWIARRWPMLREYNGDEPVLAGSGGD